MGRYRKKPVVIEAFQYKRSSPWPEGVVTVGGVPVVPTLEGDMLVSDGDWIITGVAGERYPCKPEIFEATYEAVKDEENGDG